MIICVYTLGMYALQESAARVIVSGSAGSAAPVVRRMICMMYRKKSSVKKT